MSLPAPPRHRISPSKLPLSKWTAAAPQNKEKHFLVLRLVEPATPGAAVTEVELQAVHSKRLMVLPWRALEERSAWLRGWV